MVLTTPTSPEDLLELEGSIARTLIAYVNALKKGESPCDGWPLYWQEQDTGALVISFDSEWTPFLGSTKGHNSLSSRWTLRGHPRLMTRIVGALRENARAIRHRDHGGRLFLSKRGVHFKNASGIKDWAAKWNLPRESGLLP